LITEDVVAGAFLAQISVLYGIMPTVWATAAMKSSVSERPSSLIWLFLYQRTGTRDRFIKQILQSHRSPSAFFDFLPPSQTKGYMDRLIIWNPSCPSLPPETPEQKWFACPASVM